MVEYLHNAIRATAGEIIPISAIILGYNDQPITESCKIELFDNEGNLIKGIEGSHMGEGFWLFGIPKEVTEGLKGRYWYSIKHFLDGNSLSFKNPIYLV